MLCVYGTFHVVFYRVTFWTKEHPQPNVVAYPRSLRVIGLPFCLDQHRGLVGNAIFRPSAVVVSRIGLTESRTCRRRHRA